MPESIPMIVVTPPTPPPEMSFSQSSGESTKKGALEVPTSDENRR